MKTLLVIVLINLFSGYCYGYTDEEFGLQIMEELDRRDSGFGDNTVETKMILKNKSGDETLRMLKISTLEVRDDGNKSLTIFESPLDIKGTSFLSYTHALIPDEQWLYLPDLKRTKRISSSNKSGSFLGSEYAYEDLTSFEIQKYKYKYLREDILQNKTCHVVELYPQYEDSGYTKQIFWIEKDRYIPLKTEYFDRKDTLLKTQEYSKYNQYLGRYWRSNEMNIINHQNGRSTKMISEKFDFKTNLTARNFDQHSLQHSK